MYGPKSRGFRWGFSSQEKWSYNFYNTAALSELSSKEIHPKKRSAFPIFSGNPTVLY